MRRRRSSSRIIATTLLLVAATGCSRSAQEDPAVDATWIVAPSPARVGPATVVIMLTDSLGQPVTDAGVNVEGTMTHPGMLPVSATAAEIAPGHYEAVLELGMAGDWILLLDATLPGGTRLERRHEVPGVRSEGDSE